MALENQNIAMWKKILYVCLPLLAFVILYDICTAFLQYLGNIIIGVLGDKGVIWLAGNQGTFKALCIMGGLSLTFVCMFKTALQDGFLTPKKEVWKIPVWQYAIIVIGSIVLAYGCNYLFAVSGFTASSESYQNVAQSQYDVSLVVGLILYGVVSPFVEEVIFRGFLYGRMKVYMSKVVALFLSSLLFGIYHGNLVQGTYGFIMGVIFALVYEKYKNFYLAAIMHAMANLVAYFIQLNGFI